MPVTIPAGTKFEAIKPTTNVNRRSALVNANDLTYTIEDIAAAAGGGSFPITNNYIPKANAAGSIVDSALLESTDPFGNHGLYGNYLYGLQFESQAGVNLFTIDNTSQYMNIGDIFGLSGYPAYGIQIDNNPGYGYINFTWNGNSLLSFQPTMGSYNFGGTTTKFGISDADTLSSSLYVTPDLVTNVAGTNYIKVEISGTPYKIALVP